MKHDLDYNNTILHFCGHDLTAVAAETGTPAWIYGLYPILDRVRAYQTGLGTLPHGIRYAVKANDSGAILRAICRAGCGAVIVSGNELRKCHLAGMNSSEIVFSGACKTPEEIDLAIASDIGAIHIESEEELEMVAARAHMADRVVRVGIRVDPNVSELAHAHAATRSQQHASGVPFTEAALMFKRMREQRNLRPVGVAAHLGSQITDIEQIYLAAKRLVNFADELRYITGGLEYVDAGGGLAVDYAQRDGGPDIEGFSRGLADRVSASGYRLLIEPGRSIVAEAGILLTRVVYRKENPTGTSLLLDAAMNELIGPSLYGVSHPILPVVLNDYAEERVGIAGPVCETGHFFRRDVILSRLSSGSLIAIGCAGAYGRVMSSNYNSRDRCSEWLLEEGAWRLVRRRETFEDLIRADVEPSPERTHAAMLRRRAS